MRTEVGAIDRDEVGPQVGVGEVDAAVDDRRVARGLGIPVKAIFAEDETPANWKNFIELNKQFFKDNPGVKPATKS